MTKAEELVQKLIEKDLHISCAESCTGGMLTGAIVDVADASKVLHASVVTYSNEAKQQYLGVREETLAAFGAVSEQTAAEMAVGIAKANLAEVGVAITGIAGPGGGTKEKPVGTVCFGFSVNGKVSTKKRKFGEIGRNEVRAKSADFAIEEVLRLL